MSPLQRRANNSFKLTPASRRGLIQALGPTKDGKDRNSNTVSVSARPRMDKVPEGDEASPAAEIQFGGQPLCVFRENVTQTAEMEFLGETYGLSQAALKNVPFDSFKFRSWRAAIYARGATT